MASGAPRPGGYHAPAPGGLQSVPAGGTNMNSFTLRNHYDGYPDFAISPGDGSGARVAITRSVVNLRRGRASAGAAPTYNWTLPTKPGGSVATVSGGTTASASITPDAAGLYVLQCAVTFSDGTVITKSVSYTSA